MSVFFFDLAKMYFYDLFFHCSFPVVLIDFSLHQGIPLDG